MLFKLPVNQEYTIRQSFAAFLLLTPLFFSEFLDSNDKGMAARAYIGREGPCRPLGGATGPLAFFLAWDLIANLKKKKYTYGMSPYGGATGGYF